MIIITNICGGGERRIRSVATLAKLGAAQPYGGWEVIRNDGLPADGLSREDVYRVLVWARYRVLVWARVPGRRPRTAREWREVAREAIAFDRRGNID